MLKELLQLLIKLFTKQEVKRQPDNGGKVADIPKMGISLKELLKDKDFNTLDKTTKDNIMTLLERINKVRDAYGKSMIVTSGLRSMEEHLAIYKAKGITDESMIPLKSKHLYGQAIDISDPNKQLQKWIKDNIKLIEDIGLWMEDFNYTSNWVHFQIVPPKSGKRFFIP